MQAEPVVFCTLYERRKATVLNALREQLPALLASVLSRQTAKLAGASATADISFSSRQTIAPNLLGFFAVEPKRSVSEKKGLLLSSPLFYGNSGYSKGNYSDHDCDCCIEEKKEAFLRLVVA